AGVALGEHRAPAGRVGREGVRRFRLLAAGDVLAGFLVLRALAALAGSRGRRRAGEQERGGGPKNRFHRRRPPWFESCDGTGSRRSPLRRYLRCSAPLPERSYDGWTPALLRRWPSDGSQLSHRTPRAAAHG